MAPPTCVLSSRPLSGEDARTPRRTGACCRPVPYHLTEAFGTSAGGAERDLNESRYGHTVCVCANLYVQYRTEHYVNPFTDVRISEIRRVL